MSSLLFFDPADDLIPVKDQSATGLEAEVRKPSGNKGLPDAPRRAADEDGNIGDSEGRAESRGRLADNGLGFTQEWPRLPRPMPRPALAGLR